MLVLPLGGPALAEVVAAGVDPAISVAGVLAIAPVCDLVSAAQEGLSDFHDAVPNLLWRFGHTAKEPAAPGAGLQHEAAAAACPVSLLRRLPPLAAAPRVLLVHGDRDTDVPPSLPLGFGEGPEKRLFTRRRRRTGAALAEPRLRRGCVGRARRPRDVAAPRARVGPPRGEDKTDRPLPALPPRPPLPALPFQARPSPPVPPLHSRPTLCGSRSASSSPTTARHAWRDTGGYKPRCGTSSQRESRRGAMACHHQRRQRRGAAPHPPCPSTPAPQHPNPRALAARALSTLARGGR